MLESGADPNYTRRNKSTPLIVACLNNHTEIVKLLLNHNADLNIKFQDSKAPLDYARANGHEEIIKLILRKKGENNLPPKYLLLKYYLADIMWTTSRLLWIGKLKNEENEECLLRILPKEIIFEIIRTTFAS